MLKALKKNPQERYVTATAFVDDIERYLDGHPVLARPDSATYRVNKFVRRNWLAVGAAAAVLLAVLGGVGISLWPAQVARVERMRAEEVKEFIASVFSSADPYSGGSRSMPAVELLQQARSRVDQIQPAYPEMRAEINDLLPILRARAGESPQDLVTVLQYRAHQALDEGQYEEAEHAAAEALRLAESRLGARHPATAQAAMMLAQTDQYGRPRPELALQMAEKVVTLVSDIHRDNLRHPRVVDMRHI